MEELILTSISKQDLQDLIKKCIRDVLKEQQSLGESLDDGWPMTIKEVSKLLNLTPPTIYGYTSKNLIPHSKRGNRLFFNKKELVDWINEGKRKTIDEIEKEAHLYLSKPKRRK